MVFQTSEVESGVIMVFGQITPQDSQALTRFTPTPPSAGATANKPYDFI